MKQSYDELITSIEMPKTGYSEFLGVDTNRNNVVDKDTMRSVQLRTLSSLAEFISHTFGPMGSNSKIIRGSDANTIVSEYSKDGHKVLKNILFSNPIEMSIQAEVVDITHHVEQEIGDGTTSAVLLASQIFNYIATFLDTHCTVQPYKVVKTIESVISEIQQTIISNGREVKPEDIYDICMISTNGNVDISKNIADIYSRFGNDVQIDVSVSPTKDNMIKIYDGVTISEGYSDPAYINNSTKGTAEIHNPRIYAFMDPIDTMQMISLFEKIIKVNIIDPINDDESCIPTVIVSPKMSRDMSSMMESIIEIMHQCNPNQKPPLLIITDLSGSDEGIFLDIARLCGCKYIKKYIDNDIMKADEKEGRAANLDNVADFYGTCEVIVSDVGKTKFINPSKMFVKDEEGTNTTEYSAEYKGLVHFLQSEIDNARANGADSREIGIMKKRLRSLKANMVEFLVGGITIADREVVRDLVDDAVRNCASAVSNGIGRAANYEGWKASYYVMDNKIKNYSDKKSLELDIATAIFLSYNNVINELYSTVFDTSKLRNAVEKSFKDNLPFDLRTKELSDKVITSIMTDVKILEAISKLVSIMITCNQCILQAPQLNTY